MQIYKLEYKHDNFIVDNYIISYTYLERDYLKPLEILQNA